MCDPTPFDCGLTDLYIEDLPIKMALPNTQSLAPGNV